jgi:hypothetical protein
MGRCENCRVCSPTILDKILLMSVTLFMTILLLLRVEPAESRCPICGHSLKLHRGRPAV